MEVEPATLTDVYQMHACNASLLPENYTPRLLLELVLTNPSLSYVVRSDAGGLLGYILARKVTENGETYAQIVSLGVHPAARGQKLSVKLMNAVHRTCEADGTIGAVKLNVRVNNAIAQRLYREHFDYEVEGEDKGYYFDGTDGYRLVRQLRAHRSEAAR